MPSLRVSSNSILQQVSGYDPPSPLPPRMFNVLADEDTIGVPERGGSLSVAVPLLVGGATD